jgi:GntR family transcriptional regulator / MocR family aminotransferase
MPRLASPSLSLTLAADGPRFVAIARALAAELERGRWLPGQRLPSSRALATALGVHRNTVLAALTELEAQGWIATRPARGVFVSEELPLAKQAHGASGRAQRSAGYPLPALPSALREVASGPAAGPGRAPDGKRTMQLSAGVPDPRRFPTDALARAWRRVVRRSAQTLLSYGDPQGHPALRAALAEMIRSARGVPATAEHVLLTRGSQMALDLCARALVPRGARVAVEAYGYAPAWNALRLAGAELVPVPVDDEGLQVDALTRLLEPARGRGAAHRAPPIAAVYVTPHHQYPTTVTLSPARRLALGALARRHRLLVLEDDYDHEFHYHSRPVAPLAAGDDGEQVVYIGTLSKVLAPGLRLGFVIAPPPVIARLTQWRAAMDRQGDQATEAAVAELIEDGELARHMRRMQVAYRERRDALAAALTRELAGAITVNVPRGGISLWAPVAPGLDVPRWLTACAAAGVSITPGARFTFDGHDPRALRLVYAPWTPAELSRAVALMAAALPRPTPARRRR